MAKALRDAYGEALVKYGETNPDIIVLDADVASSTKSCLFAAAYPDRAFNVGIAEANMVAMAAGFATVGKIPFVNTFAVFLATIGALSTRALIAYNKLNVKLIGAYGGLSDSYDGASHHSTEDIAMMRLLPGMTVWCASDEIMVDWMVKKAIDNKGPMYIRLSREANPIYHNENTTFETGKGIVLKDGTDATVFACGVMVSIAMLAAEILEKKGTKIRVVDMFSIKPIDRALILKCAQETKAIVTAEEHSIIGGLGSAVSEVLALGGCPATFEMVGIKDLFTESGAYNKLLEKYELDAKAIVKSVEKAIAAKKDIAI